MKHEAETRPFFIQSERRYEAPRIRSMDATGYIPLVYWVSKECFLTPSVAISVSNRVLVLDILGNSIEHGNERERKSQ